MYICNNVRVQDADVVAGHGTNVDGLWLRAKAPRGLQVGSVIKFGASSRSYTVRPPVLLTHLSADIVYQNAVVCIGFRSLLAYGAERIEELGVHVKLV